MPDELSVSHSRGNAGVPFVGVCRCWLVQQWNPAPSITLLDKPAVAPSAYAHHHSSTTDASTATEDLCAVTLYAVDTPSISGFTRSTDNADSKIEPKNERTWRGRPHRRYNRRKLSFNRFREDHPRP